jgi:hypothetical protein
MRNPATPEKAIMRTGMILSGVFAMALTIGAAEAPYFGTWIYNPSKSDWGTIDVTFARVGADELEQTWSTDGKPSRFKIDGKEYRRADGVGETWKQLDPGTWEVASRVNGKAAANDTFKLSADGNTLTDTSTPVGSATIPVLSVVMHRAASGAGLVGTWKGEKVKMTSFTLEISPDQKGTITYRVPDVFEIHGKFDGKTYPMSGSLITPGSTATLISSGPHGFSMKQMQPGGPTMSLTATVSDDGKTLTEVGIQVEPSARHTWVFDRKK